MDKLDEVAKKLMFKIDDEVSKKLTSEWKSIEAKINKLKAFDTSDIEPMIRINEEHQEYLREDEPGEVFDREVVLKNAPQTKEDYVLLPKVVKND